MHLKLYLRFPFFSQSMELFNGSCLKSLPSYKSFEMYSTEILSGGLACKAS